MNPPAHFLITTLFSFISIFGFSQEWKNLKSYKKAEGTELLNKGNWLKKDRKRQSDIWLNACRYNLGTENGNAKYESISQIRDFYHFFDQERKIQGHEIQWMGIAAIAAGQLSILDHRLIRSLFVRNREIVEFAHEGSATVFAFSFPELKKLYFSGRIIVGNEANDWDLKHGMTEQCEVLEPLYHQLSGKAKHRLERMAQGKGIYGMGVPKEIRYTGHIENCRERYEHGLSKLIPYCSKRN
ncbi:MAG: hypothetical protein WAO52_13035 [Prolixibacteraceae bacterium]